MNSRLTKRLAALVYLVVPCTLAVSAPAWADTTIAKGDGWEIFTNGRVNAFQSYSRGDSFPEPLYDPTMPGVILHTAKGGGVSEAFVERPTYPAGDPRSLELQHGLIEGSRVRSGFLGNIFGFGVRRQLTQWTTATAYISIWAFIESEAQRKYRPVFPDVREGYVKLEGPWGSFLAGRGLTLFNRGGTTIDFLYGHGYGLGFPGSINVNGPAAGQIGFGLLANGFAAGLVYATPTIAGLQLTVGYYDPASIVGTRLERTKWGRPEAELTFESPLGSSGKLVLFTNGGYQKVYQGDATFERTVYGAAYGGRFEMGPVRLGFSGHWGRGLGLNYALEPSLATVSEDGAELRTFSGYYGQAMLVFGKFSVSGGAGITRVAQLASDKLDNRDNDGDATTPASNDDADPNTPDPVANSYIKTQLGINAGVFYAVTNYLVIGVDYFRADFKWWEGETQLVQFLNSGITMTW